MRSPTLDALAFMVRMLLSRTPDFGQWECDRGHPMLKQPMLATNSPEWLASANQQQVHLLLPVIRAYIMSGKLTTISVGWVEP